MTLHKPPAWITLAIVLAVGAVGTAQLFLISRHSERALHYAHFLDAAHSLQHLLETRIAQRLEDLDGLRHFLTAMGEIDTRTFHAIANTYLGEHGNIQALEWVPRVTDSARASHEAAARATGLETYAIRQRGENGALQPATARSEYFPIRYAEPHAGNLQLLGYDLAADAVRRAALEKARDSAGPVVTGRVGLLQRNAPGLVMVAPVFRGAAPGGMVERRRQLRGYVLAVFSLEDLFAVKQPGNALGVSICDASASPAAQVLYTLPRVDTRAGTATPAFTLHVPLTVADRRWRLALSQSQPALEAFPTGNSWLILMLGLLATAAAGAFVLAMQHNLRRQRQLAGERAAHLDYSEARLGAVVENIQVGLILIDRHGAIEAFNPAASRLFGYEPAEVLGRNVNLLMPEPYASRHDSFIANYLTTGKPKIIGIGREVEGLRKDGSTFPLHILVAEVRFGQDRFFVGITDDRSAEHAAKHALQASEERFQLAVAGSRDGLWDWDIASGRDYFSPRFKQLLGYAEDGLADRYETWVSRLHPDDKAATLASLDAHLRRREPYDVEFRLQTRRRGYRWFRARGQALWNAAGEPQRMAGSLTDIDPQKQILMQLHRFKTTLDMIQEGIFMFDPDTLKLGYVNPAACRQLGYSRRELLRMTPYDMKPEFDEKRFRDMTQMLIDGPEHTRRFEATHQRKDGTDVPVNIFLQYLAPEGQPPRFVAMVRDITRRRQAERKLIEAKQRAEQATQAKSVFLANMSHEIRTPMSGVLGMLELLQGTHLDEQQHSYAETAREAAETLLVVINDILDISKIEAGHMTVENIVFDLRACVEEASAAFAATAANKGLELNCFIDPELPSGVRGDPVRLRQALTNLTSNAVKFTASGEVNIRVTGSSDDDETVCVRIEVEDTGIGIEPEQLATLFEPFVQADETTTRRFGGTGLGLAICKQLVGLMGGEISVASEPEGGTRFRVNLPMTRAELNGNGFHFPDGLRVLAVDDNATNRQVLDRYLGSWNIDHVCVEDARSALRHLRQSVDDGSAFDVALLDANMPRMDGWALAAEIAKDPCLNGLRVIMLSSAGRPAAAKKQAPIERYLSKPVRLADLCAALAAQPAAPARGGAPEPAASEPLFEGARVLVVDDMPTNQLVAREMLRSRGIEAVVAGNGREAVAALGAQHFDLVLMDCRMPVMDGYAASEVIRAQERAKHAARIPIIALTAHAMPGERDKCLAAGMDDFLSKPFRGKELFACMARWLATARGAEAAANKAAPLADQEHDDHTTLFDEKHLDQLLRMPDNQVQELLDAFEQDTAEKLAELHKAAAEHNLEAIGTAAHALKGVCANLAATSVAGQCQLLESLARAGAQTQLAEQVSLIGKLLQRVTRAYRRWRPSADA